MTCTLHVAWDGRLPGYDFGPGHPMVPLRLKLTMELARAFGLDRLSLDAQRAVHAAVHKLAHQFAGGRWLLTGGGGYDHVGVVPRSWTHLLFEAAGRPIDSASAIAKS